MAKQQLQQGRNWYVLHTYSGYEDAVAQNLRQRIESLGMADKIFNVIVPKEKKIKIRGGKRHIVEEKVYPGYVLVEMIVTDDSWYVVRNTPRVTGFVGSGTTPIPVASEEIAELQKRMGVDEPKHKIEVKVGDPVKITDGPFKDFDGKVSAVDEEKGKVQVFVNMFGRETPVELDYLQISKI
ncbi:MAG: transcription termination/antitermination protein NusG [Candidatus Spechtbacteria bacterium RIFCSPLOWO2_01_FULL_46_10]|uniref:Transcription termination/antitermination protein NusG n=1 Tax=Candidatus Spechtbacteria bacterium RIFCSPLOWO2_01_FULL_46_10 TaxID=1802163 RepID=A0A1G2HEV0_9BACT|nr:MAG: transcription termination/antitermination protein NusG [Candidatus Spechtbacteria bacterium RIFCSPLOWO2_01_FULL_46_10]